MTRKINTTFKHGKLLLRVEEPLGSIMCKGCAFYKNYCISETGIKRDKKITGECLGMFRKGKKDIVFKEVKQ